MAKDNGGNRKKARNVNHLETIENSFHIFCEGVKTEPLYFEGFKKAIDENPIYKKLVNVEVIGVGAETLRVLEAAKKYVAKNDIRNSKVWIVYDKDSFPSKDFNAVSEAVRNLNSTQDKVEYCVAWSNQCIEYWFILHFSRYVSNNHREDYQKYLNSKFKELGLSGYKKNDKELFNTLSNRGNPKSAIKFAEEILEDFKQRNLSDSNCVPATKVHLLVKELAWFLPEGLRNKYF